MSGVINLNLDEIVGPVHQLLAFTEVQKAHYAQLRGAIVEQTNGVVAETRRLQHRTRRQALQPAVEQLRLKNLSILLTPFFDTWKHFANIQTKNKKAQQKCRKLQLVTQQKLLRICFSHWQHNALKTRRILTRQQQSEVLFGINCSRLLMRYFNQWTLTQLRAKNNQLLDQHEVTVRELQQHHSAIITELQEDCQKYRNEIETVRWQSTQYKQENDELQRHIATARQHSLEQIAQLTNTWQEKILSTQKIAEQREHELHCKHQQREEELERHQQQHSAALQQTTTDMINLLKSQFEQNHKQTETTLKSKTMEMEEREQQFLRERQEREMSISQMQSQREQDLVQQHRQAEAELEREYHKRYEELQNSYTKSEAEAQKRYVDMVQELKKLQQDAEERLLREHKERESMWEAKTADTARQHQNELDQVVDRLQEECNKRKHAEEKHLQQLSQTSRQLSADTVQLNEQHLRQLEALENKYKQSEIELKATHDTVVGVLKQEMQQQTATFEHQLQTFKQHLEAANKQLIDMKQQHTTDIREMNEQHLQQQRDLIARMDQDKASNQQTYSVELSKKHEEMTQKEATEKAKNVQLQAELQALAKRYKTEIETLKGNLQDMSTKYKDQCATTTRLEDNYERKIREIQQEYSHRESTTIQQSERAMGIREQELQLLLNQATREAQQLEKELKAQISSLQQQNENQAKDFSERIRLLNQDKQAVERQLEQTKEEARETSKMQESKHADELQRSITLKSQEFQNELARRNNEIQQHQMLQENQYQSAQETLESELERAQAEVHGLQQQIQSLQGHASIAAEEYNSNLRELKSAQHMELQEQQDKMLMEKEEALLQLKNQFNEQLATRSQQHTADLSNAIQKTNLEWSHKVDEDITAKERKHTAEIHALRTYSEQLQNQLAEKMQEVMKSQTANQSRAAIEGQRNARLEELEEERKNLTRRAVVAEGNAQSLKERLRVLEDDQESAKMFPHIGIEISEGSTAGDEYLNKGVRVLNVKGPAASSDVRADDIIQNVEVLHSATIHDLYDFKEAVGKLRPSDIMMMTIFRDNVTHVTQVEVEPSYHNPHQRKTLKSSEIGTIAGKRMSVNLGSRNGGTVSTKNRRSTNLGGLPPTDSFTQEQQYTPM